MTFNELYPLLRVLSDGRFHSGESLGRVCGISRAAVWKQIKLLNQFPGIEIEATRGIGYRLLQAISLIEKETIISRLEPDLPIRLECLPVTDSTNDYLLRREPPPLRQGLACIVDVQTQGKGRRGRSWFSAPGRSITFSLGWSFDLPLGSLEGLSIAIGLAVAEQIQAAGLADIKLKWPNDLLVNGEKLGGLLVEARGEMGGPCHAVIGLGLNLYTPAQAERIEQAWTCLAQHLEHLPDRNHLIADLLSAMIRACQSFQKAGLSPFLPRWQRYDAYQQQQVKIISDNSVVEGRCMGLNKDGSISLLLDTGRLMACHAGEVSLRGTD